MKIGMLFQGGALFDSKTVEENVMFPLDMLSNMSKEEKRERVNDCLKRVELDHAAKRMPSEISGYFVGTWYGVDEIPPGGGIPAPPQLPHPVGWQMVVP